MKDVSEERPSPGTGILKEIPDLTGDNFHQPLSGFHSRPGDMRGDEQPALICDSEQRVVFRHRFFAEDIQTGSQDFMIVRRDPLRR